MPISYARVPLALLLLLLLLFIVIVVVIIIIIAIIIIIIIIIIIVIIIIITVIFFFFFLSIETLQSCNYLAMTGLLSYWCRFIGLMPNYGPAIYIIFFVCTNILIVGFPSGNHQHEYDAMTTKNGSRSSTDDAQIT